MRYYNNYHNWNMRRFRVGSYCVRPRVGFRQAEISLWKCRGYGRGRGEAINTSLRRQNQIKTSHSRASCHFCRVLWPFWRKKKKSTRFQLFFPHFSSIFKYIHPSTYSLVSKRTSSFAIPNSYSVTACLSPPLAKREKSNRWEISHTATPP